MSLAFDTFNEGYFAVLKVMETMGIRIGPKCKAVADRTDSEQIDSACRKSKVRSETDKSRDKPAEIEDFYEENEPFYGPRIAN